MIKATYRIAQEKDLEEVFEVLREMHEEVGLSSLSVEKTVHQIVTLFNEGVIFLAVISGRIVGTMGIGPAQWWYSDDFYLTDYWTFVRKGYRRSMIASDLLQQAKDFAQKIEFPIAVAVLSPTDVPRKNALFRRHFTPVGEIFVEGF